MNRSSLVSTSLVFCATVPLYAAEFDRAVEPMTLESRVAGGAIAYDLGVVAMTDDSTSVSIYPELAAGSAKRGAQIRLSAVPVAIRYKRAGDKAYFLASCADQSLQIIDARTLMVVKAVPLGGSPTSLAAPADSRATFAYCAARRSNMRTMISRVNLSTFAVDGETEMPDALSSNIDLIQTSAPAPILRRPRIVDLRIDNIKSRSHDYRDVRGRMSVRQQHSHSARCNRQESIV